MLVLLCSGTIQTLLHQSPFEILTGIELQKEIRRCRSLPPDHWYVHVLYLYLSVEPQMVSWVWIKPHLTFQTLLLGSNRNKYCVPRWQLWRLPWGLHYSSLKLTVTRKEEKITIFLCVIINIFICCGCVPTVTATQLQKALLIISEHLAWQFKTAKLCNNL